MTNESQWLTLGKNFVSEDEIKEGVDYEVDVLHSPRVEHRAAPVVRGRGQLRVLHGVVQDGAGGGGGGVTRGLWRGEILTLEQERGQPRDGTERLSPLYTWRPGQRWWNSL